MPTELTPAQLSARRDRINKVIDKWAPKLGLYAWDIRATGSEPGPGVSAEVEFVPLQDCAQISVSRDADSCSARKFEHLVVHELIHVVMHPLEYHVTEMAAALGDSHTGPLLVDQINRLNERVVDQLAQAFVPVGFPVVKGETKLEAFAQ